MLVLSRKFHESIMIGKDVTVTVVKIKGDQVRIGVTAPKDVPVHRGEVFVKIKEEAGDGDTPGG